MTGTELGKWVLECLEGNLKDDPSFVEWCNPESVSQQLCETIKQYSHGITSEEMSILKKTIKETVINWLSIKKKERSLIGKF